VLPTGARLGYGRLRGIGPHPMTQWPGSTGLATQDPGVSWDRAFTSWLI
jgi:hypothetical protein